MLNALLAAEGELLLRIDDLDRGRFRPEYLDDVFRVIDWLGITITEGPKDSEDFEQNWSQRHRMKLYNAALDDLRREERLFACPCTRRELADGDHIHGCLAGRVDLDSPGVAWRINTRELGLISIPDQVRTSNFRVDLHGEIPDFVVRTKAGQPSYQLACTVDDQFFAVNTVGRGQDLLPSTAAQSVLSGMLGYESLFERITFVHHPLIAEVDGEKLSKSAGARGVSAMFSELSPQDVFRMAEDWLRE